MIEIKLDMSLIQAWNELNKINNKINFKETLLSTRLDIGTMKLKEVITSCTFNGNDKLINNIITNDEDAITLRELYKAQRAYEIYIMDEINRMKLSSPALCIAFLREYQHKKWNEIAKFFGYEKKQCQRYYDEYLGKTPQDNNWLKDSQA